jgi:antitoxin component YwqK of YwqJK toxin-antitoxin module
MTALLTAVLVSSALAWADDAPAAEACAAQGGKWQTGLSSGCLVKGKKEGKWVERGPGGQVLDETTWKAGRRDGPTAAWFGNCQVKWRGAYLAGQRDGEWTEWAIDGKKVSQGTWTKNVRTGTWTFFHAQSGEKHLEGPYVSGQMTGTFKEHLPTGELWREVEFRGGERVGDKPEACKKQGGRWVVDFDELAEGCLVNRQRAGEWRTFDGHGKLRSLRRYLKGVLHGPYEEFHPTGEPLRVGQYVDGLPEGVHEFRAPDGTLYGSSTVRDGTGEWKTWHPTGKPAVHGRYLQGCPEGRWRIWDEEGQLIVEDTYADCRRNGPYTDYHDGNAPRRMGSFVDGEEQGEWVQKWRNGKVEWQGQYEKGARVGQWRFYRWDGSLYRVGEFVDDVGVGEWTYFFPDGKEEARGQYQAGKQDGPWKLSWPTGTTWREADYLIGSEQSEPAQRCRAWGGAWVSDVEKGRLGCQVCRAKPDDTIEPVDVGVWTYWHSDGTLEKRGELVEGKPVGHWEYFHDNGALMLEGDYDGGVEEGAWKGFYRSGQPRFVGGYVAGKPTGEWTSFHPDGGVLSVGRYETGQKVGRWRYHTKAAPEEVDYAPDGGR